MNPEARKYLAAIGRRGGKTSRRTLTKAQARAMVRARTAKHAARRGLDAAHGSTVPFNEANLDRLEKATLLDGVKVECGDGRSVEVWRVKEEDGYCIRIFRPTNDGKISKLMFGLKPPAAHALMIALSRHLSNDKAMPQEERRQ